ncbi:MAG: hypothetical protein K8T26_15580 [Lentisphaerae bacterium]|nr:hypothetical protein [Lentisphaerota bacterium]
MRIPALFLLLGLLAPVLCLADGSAPASPSTIHLIVSAPSDPAWPERIARHVEETLSVPVIVTVQTGAPSATAAFQCCQSLATEPEPRQLRVCLVFGVTPPSRVEIACEIKPEQQCATVWADGLKPGAQTASPQDAETWLMRVDKQVTYATGRLLGLQPCGFLLCVMHASATLEDVDLKAPNLCPPSREALPSPPAIME